MKKQMILAALCLAGAAGIAQADTLKADVVVPTSTAALQSGHLMKVARVLLGYDAFGNPVYGFRHLPRTIVGYDRFGRPIYGHIYNNRPLFLEPNVVGTIVRPYNYAWDWGGRHWDRHGDRDFDRHAFHGDRGWRHHDDD